MNQAGFVGGLQTLPCCDVHAQDVLPFVGRIALPLRQRGSVYKLHRDEELSLDFTDLVDVDDVRGGHPRKGLGFPNDVGV